MAGAKYKDWMAEEKLTLLEGWSRSGLSKEQIAHNMGVRRVTLDDWIKKYPCISSAFKKGKDIADFEVENALFKRAKGYDTEEVIEDYALNNDGELILAKVRKTKKHIPADTAAQIFWLKNRRPDKWRDKMIQQTVSEDDGTGVVLLPEVTDTDE